MIFLPAFFSTRMFYRDVEHVFPLVGTDITAVSIGLFLKIVMSLPNNIVLCNNRKGCNAGEIGWVQYYFQERKGFGGSLILPFSFFAFL